MKSSLKWLDENLEKVFAVALICVMTIILFIQVIARRIFNSSLSWSEELARYLFIWLIYISISMGAKQMAHLKVEAFLGIFPKKLRPYVVILSEILVLLFAVIIVYYGFILLQRQISLGQTSAALRIPMWIVYLAPVIGFAMTAVRQVQIIVFRVKQLKSGGEGATEDVH